MTKHIATSPLTGRIHQGRGSKDGRSFVGDFQLAAHEHWGDYSICQPLFAEPQTQQAQKLTVPDNMQDWKGMDGTTAWHLIERHADNWVDVGKMMDEWLAANQPAQQAQKPVQFLASGARFKTSVFPYGVCINGLPKELAGRWVALVAAEDDCHLALTPAAPQRPLVQQALEAFETDDWQKKMQAAIDLRKWLEQNP